MHKIGAIIYMCVPIDRSKDAWKRPQGIIVLDWSEIYPEVPNIGQQAYSSPSLYGRITRTGVTSGVIPIGTCKIFRFTSIEDYIPTVVRIRFANGRGTWYVGLVHLCRASYKIQLHDILGTYVQTVPLSHCLHLNNLKNPYEHLPWVYQV